MINQSLCYPMFGELPVSLEELFARGAQMGYAAVECWAPGEDFAQTVALAKSHGLRMASFSGHNSLENGLNNPFEHERIERELRASIDLAARHDVPGIIVFSGNVRSGQSETDAIAATAAGLWNY